MEENKACSKDCGCGSQCQEELTLEQAKARIAELEAKNAKPAKKELTPQQKEELVQKQKLFNEMQRGAYFIEFVLKDLHQAGFNRDRRRRLIKELMNKQFSMEFIDAYLYKVNEIVKYLDERLNTSVDGADFYNKAKEAEQKGELKDV